MTLHQSWAKPQKQDRTTPSFIALLVILRCSLKSRSAFWSITFLCCETSYIRQKAQPPYHKCKWKIFFPANIMILLCQICTEHINEELINHSFSTSSGKFHYRIYVDKNFVKFTKPRMWPGKLRIAALVRELFLPMIRYHGNQDALRLCFPLSYFFFMKV